VELPLDGNHGADSKDSGGRPAAAIYTVNTKNPPKLIGDSRDIVFGIRWAKNDRLLITLNTDAKVPGDTKVRPYYQTISVDPEGEHEAEGGDGGGRGEPGGRFHEDRSTRSAARWVAPPGHFLRR